MAYLTFKSGGLHLAWALPKDGSYPHDVAVVEHIVGEQGQGWVTLVPHAGVDDATGQQGPRLYRDTTG